MSRDNHILDFILFIILYLYPAIFKLINYSIYLTFGNCWQLINSLHNYTECKAQPFRCIKFLSKYKVVNNEEAIKIYELLKDLINSPVNTMLNSIKNKIKYLLVTKLCYLNIISI